MGLPQQRRQIQLGGMKFAIFEKHLAVSPNGATVQDRVKYYINGARYGKIYKLVYALNRIGPTLRSYLF